MKIGITTAEMEVINAIRQMQPCTIKLMNTVMITQYNTSSKQILSLLQKGLIEKKKAPPLKKTTEEERIDREIRGLKPFTAGRRPWIFTIPPSAREVANAIDLLAGSLHSHRRNKNGQRSNDIARSNGELDSRV